MSSSVHFVYCFRTYLHSFTSYHYPNSLWLWGMLTIVWYVCHSWSAHSLLGTWIVSSFELLWIVLLWTLLCEYISILSPILLSIYLKAQWWFMRYFYVEFVEPLSFCTASKWTILHSQQWEVRVRISVHPCQPWLFGFVIIGIFVGVE